MGVTRRRQWSVAKQGRRVGKQVAGVRWHKGKERQGRTDTNEEDASKTGKEREEKRTGATVQKIKAASPKMEEC